MRRRITTAKREEIEKEQKLLDLTIVRPFETLNGLPISYSAPPSQYGDILKNPLTVKDSAVLYNSLLRSRDTIVHHAPMFKLHWVRQTAYAKKLAEMDKDKQKEVLEDRENKRRFAKATSNSLEAHFRQPVLTPDINARDVMSKLCESAITIGPHSMDIRIYIAKDSRSEKGKRGTVLPPGPGDQTTCLNRAFESLPPLESTKPSEKSPETVPGSGDATVAGTDATIKPENGEAEASNTQPEVADASSHGPEAETDKKSNSNPETSSGQDLQDEKNADPSDPTNEQSACSPLDSGNHTTESRAVDDSTKLDDSPLPDESKTSQPDVSADRINDDDKTESMEVDETPKDASSEIAELNKEEEINREDDSQPEVSATPNEEEGNAKEMEVDGDVVQTQEQEESLKNTEALSQDPEDKEAKISAEPTIDESESKMEVDNETNDKVAEGTQPEPEAENEIEESKEPEGKSENAEAEMPKVSDNDEEREEKDDVVEDDDNEVDKVDIDEEEEEEEEDEEDEEDSEDSEDDDDDEDEYVDDYDKKRKKVEVYSEEEQEEEELDEDSVAVKSEENGEAGQKKRGGPKGPRPKRQKTVTPRRLSRLKEEASKPKRLPSPSPSPPPPPPPKVKGRKRGRPPKVRPPPEPENEIKEEAKEMDSEVVKEETTEPEIPKEPVKKRGRGRPRIHPIVEKKAPEPKEPSKEPSVPAEKTPAPDAAAEPSSNQVSTQTAPPPPPPPANLQSIDNIIMISNLNTIAETDLSLNGLMKRVALGKAPEEEVNRFKGYIEQARRMGPQPHHADLYFKHGLPLPPNFPRVYPMRPPQYDPQMAYRQRQAALPKLTAFQERYLYNATLVIEFHENANVRYIIPQDSICEILEPEKPPPEDGEEGTDYKDVLFSHIWIHNMDAVLKYEKDLEEYDQEMEKFKKEEEEKKKLIEENEKRLAEGLPIKEEPVILEPKGPRNKKKGVKTKENGPRLPKDPNLKYTAYSFTLHNIPTKYVPIVVNSVKPLPEVRARMEKVLRLGTRVPSYYLWYRVDARLDEKFAESLRFRTVEDEKDMVGMVPPVEPKKRKPSQNKGQKQKKSKEGSPDGRPVVQGYPLTAKGYTPVLNTGVTGPEYSQGTY